MGGLAGEGVFGSETEVSYRAGVGLEAGEMAVTSWNGMGQSALSPLPSVLSEGYIASYFRC